MAMVTSKFLESYFNQIINQIKLTGWSPGNIFLNYQPMPTTCLRQVYCEQINTSVSFNPHPIVSVQLKNVFGLPRQPTASPERSHLQILQRTFCKMVKPHFSPDWGSYSTLVDRFHLICRIETLNPILLHSFHEHNKIQRN